jgi:hypothetical protein
MLSLSYMEHAGNTPMMSDSIIRARSQGYGYRNYFVSYPEFGSFPISVQPIADTGFWCEDRWNPKVGLQPAPQEDTR